MVFPEERDTLLWHTHMSPRTEVWQGTLALMVLKTLSAMGPQHGYGISQAIRANSMDAFQVDTGSLYPALHRLAKQKLIAAAWKTSENRQRIRVYRLTKKGRDELASGRSRWMIRSMIRRTCSLFRKNESTLRILPSVE